MILKRIFKNNKDSKKSKEFVNSGFNRYELHSSVHNKPEIIGFNNEERIFKIEFDRDFTDFEDYKLHHVYIMNDNGKTIEQIS